MDTGFAYLKGTHYDTTDFPFEDVVYLYLISSIEIEDEKAYSSLKRSDLYALPFNRGKIKHSLQVLIEECEYIIKHGTRYQIGTVTDGVVVLFCFEEEEDIEEVKDKLRPFFVSYRKALQKRGRAAMFEKASADMATLFEKKTESWNTRDLIMFYMTTVQVVYQEPARRVTSKEAGQFSHLEGFYSMGDCIRMVCEYVTNNTKYSKGLPTIGGLLYNKDKVYSFAKGVTSATAKAATYEDASERFS